METDRAVSPLQPLEQPAHLVPGLLAGDLGQEGLGGRDDLIKQLGVLVAQHQSDADGLGVVGGGREREDLLDNLLDACVRDGRGVLEGVDAAAVLGGLEELVRGDAGGCHFG